MSEQSSEAREPESGTAAYPREKGCFNCGMIAVAQSEGGLPLCEPHFWYATIAGWKPKMYAAHPPAPPDAQPPQAQASA